MAARAVTFDFNGTLSDDEPILCAVFQELFAELGRPLTDQDYYEGLAGHTDEEIFERWLGYSDATLVGERIARYRSRVRDGSTIDDESRAAVRYAAQRVPVALVTGAAREEIAPLLEAAGLGDVFSTVVAAGDVEHGKPDPEPYVLATRLLDVAPADTIAFEDTPAGLASAKAAGLRVVGITSTVGPARMVDADELVPRLRLATLRRLLG